MMRGLNKDKIMADVLIRSIRKDLSKYSKLIQVNISNITHERG